MQRPVNTGPRLTKKARERKHEQEKADKALGGGQIIEDGEDDKKKAPHWWVELQWFKLLRGDKRLYQIARILVELAPAKLFDPRDTYNQHLKNESATSKLIAANSGKEEKGDKKRKKINKERTNYPGKPSEKAKRSRR